MPTIAELGHVGLYVTDLDVSRRFYTEILEMTVTDEAPERGMVFLSARPGVEHHEVLLMSGRQSAPDTKVVQQVSFRCESLEDVLAFYERLVAHAVPINMSMTHGNAIGVYFADPDGNNCELYYRTDFEARQPFLRLLDFSKPAAEIMNEVRHALAERQA